MISGWSIICQLNLRRGIKMITILISWLDSQSTSFNPTILYFWSVCCDVFIICIIDEIFKIIKKEG